MSRTPAANPWTKEAATDEEDRHIAVEVFKNGFLRFLESGALSDITIKTSDNEEYHVHRIILAHSSAFFDKLLSGEFKESKQSTVELKFPDEGHVFAEVLRFMYTGQVDISEKNAIPLLGMADQYLIMDLRDRVRNYITINITKNNCVSVLKQVLAFSAGDEILANCMTTVAKNFSIIADSGTEDFSFMSVNDMIELLNHEELAVKNEMIVYNAVAKFVDTRSQIEEVTEQQIVDLFSCVRFAFLSYPQLQKAEKNTLVPRNLIIDGIMYRLRRTECPDAKPDENERPIPLRPVYGLHFEYKYNFDNNGIIAYYHGGASVTGRHIDELCFETKACTVTCSSIEKGSVDNFILNTPSEAWTKDVPSSWVCFDFGENRKILTTYYTLRHGGNYKADSLRNWDFQGSNDGSTWRVLRRHTNDNSLHDKFKAASWPIVDSRQGYRMFRIVQNGHNSSNHNFLVLCGFEIYGTLYES